MALPMDGLPTLVSGAASKQDIPQYHTKYNGRRGKNEKEGTTLRINTAAINGAGETLDTNWQVWRIS